MKNDSDTPAPQTTRWDYESGPQWLYIVIYLTLGVVAVCAALWAHNPSLNACGQSRTSIPAIVISCILGLIALFCLILSLTARVRWTETVLEYRTMKLKWVQVQRNRITAYGEGEYSFGVDYGTVNLRIPKQLGYKKKLLEILRSDLKTSSPEMFYVPAYKELLEEANNAGCFRCATVYSTQNVTDWNEEEDDLAICPACKSSEAVVFGVEDIIVSKQGLDKWNADYLSELEGEERVLQSTKMNEGREQAKGFKPLP